LNLAKSTIKALCVGSEIDSVRFKAAEFIVNEVKGRNDLKALKENKFNIVMISETMSKAREAMRNARTRKSQTVELEAVAA